jgi:hypothetical protein
VEHKKLEEYLKAHPNDSSDDDSSESENEVTSSVSQRRKITRLDLTFLSLQESEHSDSESSSDEEFVDRQCKVCARSPFANKFGKPEKLITCFTCKNQGNEPATL